MALEELSDRAGAAAAKSVVVVELPGGREFVWLSPSDPMARWQVGDAVVFRNARWLVTGREDDSYALNLTLDELS